jgi:hypothetical protein
VSRDSRAEEELEVSGRNGDRDSCEILQENSSEVTSGLEKELSRERTILLQKMRQREQQVRQQNEELRNKKLLIELRLLERKEKEAQNEGKSGQGLERAFLDVFENISDQTVKLDEFRGPGSMFLGVLTKFFPTEAPNLHLKCLSG